MSESDINERNIFGVFLKVKRQQKQLSLRELSNKVKVGHTYLLNIENGDKPPPNDELLKKMAAALNLIGEEKQLFFDLAAKSKQIRNDKNYYLPADVAEYINKTDSAKQAIRAADCLGCSNEFWNEILEQLEK